MIVRFTMVNGEKHDIEGVKAGEAKAKILLIMTSKEPVVFLELDEQECVIPDKPLVIINPAHIVSVRMLDK